MIRLGWFWL